MEYPLLEKILMFLTIVDFSESSEPTVDTIIFYQESISIWILIGLILFFFNFKILHK